MITTRLIAKRVCVFLISAENLNVDGPEIPQNECVLHFLGISNSRETELCLETKCINSGKWPCSPSALVAQRIKRPPGVREVMGSVPVGDSDFFLCPTAPVLLIISFFTFHRRAYNSPSLFTDWNIRYSGLIWFWVFKSFNCLHFYADEESKSRKKKEQKV